MEIQYSLRYTLDNTVLITIDSKTPPLIPESKRITGVTADGTPEVRRGKISINGIPCFIKDIEQSIDVVDDCLRHIITVDLEISKKISFEEQ